MGGGQVKGAGKVDNGTWMKEIQTTGGFHGEYIQMNPNLDKVTQRMLKYLKDAMKACKPEYKADCLQRKWAEFEKADMAKELKAAPATKSRVKGK